METTDPVVSSSYYVTRQDEVKVPMTSLSTEREPAYSMTSEQIDDVTTVMMSQPLPDDDIEQQGARHHFLSHIIVNKHCVQSVQRC